MLGDFTTVTLILPPRLVLEFTVEYSWRLCQHANLKQLYARLTLGKVREFFSGKLQTLLKPIPHLPYSDVRNHELISLRSFNA